MSSLDSSERSDDNNNNDDRTGAGDNNFYGTGNDNGGSDRNTGSRVGSTEWMGFLSLSALLEMFIAMANAKASSSTKPRKTPKLGKRKNKITRKGKAAKNLTKNLSKTAGRKKRGITEGSATTTSKGG